jgi:hypothetical protein
MSNATKGLKSEDYHTPQLSGYSRSLSITRPLFCSSARKTVGGKLYLLIVNKLLSLSPSLSLSLSLSLALSRCEQTCRQIAPDRGIEMEREQE